MDCPTRGSNTLDHIYSNKPEAYKAVLHPYLGQSDHISLFLFPAYRQRLKQTTPVNKQVKLWSSDTESIVQDCFAHTDCDVFKDAATQEDSSINIEEYAECVTGYISTCNDTHHTGQKISKSEVLDEQSSTTHAACSLSCV